MYWFQIWKFAAKLRKQILMDTDLNVWDFELTFYNEVITIEECFLS